MASNDDNCPSDNRDGGVKRCSSVISGFEMFLSGISRGMTCRRINGCSGRLILVDTSCYVGSLPISFLRDGLGYPIPCFGTQFLIRIVWRDTNPIVLKMNGFYGWPRTTQVYEIPQQTLAGVGIASRTYNFYYAWNSTKYKYNTNADSLTNIPIKIM